jgi:hypothetical protein
METLASHSLQHMRLGLATKLTHNASLRSSMMFIDLSLSRLDFFESGRRVCNIIFHFVAVRYELHRSASVRAQYAITTYTTCVKKIINGKKGLKTPPLRHSGASSPRQFLDIEEENLVHGDPARCW